MEINKTVIVASRWFLFYLTYINDARSNTNQVYKFLHRMLSVRENKTKETGEFVSIPTAATPADMRSQERAGVARQYKTFKFNAVECVLLTRSVIGCRLCFAGQMQAATS